MVRTMGFITRLFDFNQGSDLEEAGPQLLIYKVGLITMVIIIIIFIMY